MISKRHVNISSVGAAERNEKRKKGQKDRAEGARHVPGMRRSLTCSFRAQGTPAWAARGPSEGLFPRRRSGPACPRVLVAARSHLYLGPVTPLRASRRHGRNRRELPHPLHTCSRKATIRNLVPSSKDAGLGPQKQPS